MSHGRGIRCSSCDLKIDRNDDYIECVKCKNDFHGKCVFSSVENYLKLRDEKKLNQWSCVTCLQRSTANEINVSSQQNLDCIEDTNSPDISNTEPNVDKLSCQHKIGECLNKKDLLNFKQEIIKDITRLFTAEIVSLKEILVAQKKLIRSLMQEKQIRNSMSDKKRGKNVSKTNPSGYDNPRVQATEISSDSSTTVHANSKERVAPGDPRSVELNQQKIMNNLIYIETDDKPKDGSKSAVAETQYDWTLVKSKKGVKPNRPPVSTVKIIDEKSVPAVQKPQMVSRKPYAPVVGTMKSGSLLAVPKRRLAFIHVSRLSPTTIIEDLEKYVGASIPGVSCEKLTSRRPDIYSSFKLVVPLELLDKAMNPYFWPEGAAVKRFFMKRRPNTLLT